MIVDSRFEGFPKMIFWKLVYIFKVKFVHWILVILQALLRIFHLRTYNGHVYFVPAPGYEAFGDKLSRQTVECSGDFCTLRPNRELPFKIQQHGYRRSIVDLQNLNWKKIDGPFVSVWLHNVPWGSEDTMAAPDAKVISFSWLKSITFSLCLFFLIVNMIFILFVCFCIIILMLCHMFIWIISSLYNPWHCSSVDTLLLLVTGGRGFNP